MFDEGPWLLDDLWRLVAETVDVERQVECRWPLCLQAPTRGSDPKLCVTHVEVISLDRPVPYRRASLAVLIQVLIDRRDRPVADVDVMEGIL